MGIEKYRKSINFDLDTTSLQEYYPNNKDWHNAYNDLERFFIKHGFSHRQGSGYVSNEELTNNNITDLMDSMNDTFTWLKYCVKKCDVTSIIIEDEYDFTHIFKERILLENISEESTSKEHKSHKRKR